MNKYAFCKGYFEGMQKLAIGEGLPIDPSNMQTTVSPSVEDLLKKNPGQKWSPAFQKEVDAFLANQPKGGPRELGGRQSVHGANRPGLRHHINRGGDIDLPSFLSEAYPGASLSEVWANLPLSAKLLIIGGGATAATAGGLKAYESLQKSRAKKKAVNPDIGELLGQLA
jgi:hypothetical protein